MKDFVDIADFSPAQLSGLLSAAIADKQRFLAGKLEPTCLRKTLAIIFEKPSLRTRVSFEAAIAQLGGAAIYLAETDIAMGKREPVKDVARVLGRMCDAIVARTFKHQTVTDLARYSARPVINALTDYSHPCQAMADIMTAIETFGDLKGRKLAYIGDGNNVARSLATLCLKLGINFTLAAPPGYELGKDLLDTLPAGESAAQYTLVRSPRSAVRGASVIYTDTWVSMGQEEERARRIQIFTPYQVNEALLKDAPKDAIVLHCLPAYRDYEITDVVMEAHAASIFAQSENRLHFQRTLVNVLISQGGIA